MKEALATGSTDLQNRATMLGINLKNVPTHVAIIMDGNGRWAQGRGLKRLLGHHEGYKTLKKVLLAANALGIKVLTAYGFSVENWRRPEDEIGGLMSLIGEAAKFELADLKRNNVRAMVSGRLSEIPLQTRQALQNMVDETATNTGIVFNLAINYGGRAEIIDAVKQLVKDGIQPEDITEEALSSRMYSPGLPDPDLMIRTAGEMRWSNFLIWESAYTELHVSQKTWPEFDEDELLLAVSAYQSRCRKFGALAQ